MHPPTPTMVPIALPTWPLISALSIPPDAILWSDAETKSLTVMSRAQVEQALRTRVPDAVVNEVLSQLDRSAVHPHFRRSVSYQENAFRIQLRPICNAPGGAA